MASFRSSGQELLNWRRKLLGEGGRAVDLDWLLDLQGGLSWSSMQKLYFDPYRSCELQESLDQLAIIWRIHLKDQIPLQYLIGRCPWRDFELEVSPGVLIPRQETELLVDFALERFKHINFGCWADLGTGSGALAVALARSLPKWEGHAVDLSKKALSLAERNLVRLAPKVEVELHLGNWWEPLKPWWGNLSLVLANPPYIPNACINELEPVVRDHEPHLALDGGPDGLFAVREIVSGALGSLSSGGWLMLEHQHDQSDEVIDLMNNAGLENVYFGNDLQGIKRFAMGQHPIVRASN